MFYGPDTATAYDAVLRLRHAKDLLADLDSTMTGHALERLRATVAAHNTGSGVFFGARAWVVAAVGRPKRSGTCLIQVTARREAIANQVGAASPGSTASEEFWLVHWPYLRPRRLADADLPDAELAAIRLGSRIGLTEPRWTKSPGPGVIRVIAVKG